MVRKSIRRKPKMQRKRQTMRGGTITGSFAAADAQARAIAPAVTEYNDFNDNLGNVVENFEYQWNSLKRTGKLEDLRGLLNTYKSDLMTVMLGKTPEEHIRAILEADKEIARTLENEICALRPSNANTRT